METTEEKPELVEAKILIPRQVLEFLKAVHDFGKWEESLEEYMGRQVLQLLEADLDSELNNLWYMKEIVKGYGLDKVKGLDIPSHVLDC
jgi:hypothetical protein